MGPHVTLPLRASEAAALAELVFEQVDGRALTDEIRDRLAGRIQAVPFETFAAHAPSLEQDPIQPSTYYIAVDTAENPLLLRLALSSSPASEMFPDAILIGRMRPGGGREIVVNAIPFSSSDHDNIRTFADKVQRSFLPRPQGTQPAIAVGNRHPEISLLAAFDAFRTIFKKRGQNLASTVQLSATREMTLASVIAARDGENPTAAGHTGVSIEHLYHAGLWAAIRAGWREGYNAEADHFIVTGDTPEQVACSVEAVKLAIEAAAGYTKFTTDTSRLFDLRADIRHPNPYSESEIDERFELALTSDERAWILNEFASGSARPLGETEVKRLAVKFGQSLKLNEVLYDHIRLVKTARDSSKHFDFEPSIDEAETLTTPDELYFYMHWLKSRGRPATLVPPNLGFKKRQAYPETMEHLEDYVHHKMWPELAPRVRSEFGGKPLEELSARVAELAAIARHFDGTLSIHSGSGKQAAVLQQIGLATRGRLNYKISGELQLQLFDVLSEQAPESKWRQLFDRMVDRCNAFAAHKAFGEESELAAKDARHYLGNAERGRVDGNLFLVFWLGNVVGSRDTKSPDGDTRFFKEKLDQLPADLLAEVRARNSRYIQWLAENLLG